jgi:glycerol-3-phosphate dehydrogenase
MRLQELPKNWDLIIIGGGITGAGILREATNLGLRVLLVTKMAVEEREHLLKEAPGLVEPLGFLLPVYENQRPGKRTLKVGLSIYDIMARERQHRFYDKTEFYRRMPYAKQEGLRGGFFFLDAQVDDSRLVLRLINESVASGARALNYTAATDILRNENGEVIGVKIEDTETHQTHTLSASAVINATGCWAEKLHASPDPERHLRPLRGSHLVLTAEALPLTQGFSFVHPVDLRSIFVLPWEGAVLVGTTDLDHKEDLAVEPTITDAEVSYLMEGLHAIFPSLEISLNDCISAFAGVRPVLSEGKLSPSAESREHVVWVDSGLVSVTGGKLTTFRRLARDTLKAAKPFLPPQTDFDTRKPLFAAPPAKPTNSFGLSDPIWRRLYGRYGENANTLVQDAEAADLSVIPGTYTLWAELPFVAKHERVRHLSDLLLRRVRIGLLTPHGGKVHLKRIRNLCQHALPWDNKRWKEEITLYLKQWNRAHAVPVQRAKRRTKKTFTPLAVVGDLINAIADKIIMKRRRNKAA